MHKPHMSIWEVAVCPVGSTTFLFLIIVLRFLQASQGDKIFIVVASCYSFVG